MGPILQQQRQPQHRMISPCLTLLLATFSCLTLSSTTSSAAVHFTTATKTQQCWGLPATRSRIGTTTTRTTDNSRTHSIRSSNNNIILPCLIGDASSASCLAIPRGGSTKAPTESDKDDQDNDDDDEDDDDNNNDSSSSKSKITSSEPVTVLIKTNMNNKLVDIPVMELAALRTRNIDSIKKQLARQLPGKPPLELIRLLQHGQVLRDELLVDELIDDDDDEDDDEDEDDGENKKSLTLVLDMVPPIDPRSLSNHLKETLEESSTADLLEAYTLNEAAIWFSSNQFIGEDGKREQGDEEDEDDEEDATTTAPTSSSSPPQLISFQLRQYATTLQSQIHNNLLTDKAALLLEDPIPPAKAAAEQARTPQVKGQRIRPAATGGTTTAVAGGGAAAGPASPVVGLKQTAQHYLNIHWGDTIRNVCLFLFFGWFGGRTVMSRAVLLLGAPLCFVVQARPVKFWCKELLFIVLRNPPTIVLSLLPAPQQALLSLSDQDALQMIYGDDAPTVAVVEESEEEEITEEGEKLGGAQEWEDEEYDEEDYDETGDEDDF